MDSETPYLSVIIPAYDEEKRITKTLEAVDHYLDQQPFDWEVLVVLDGARDNTLEKIEAFARSKEGYHWIDRKQNRGKGYSVRQGMLAASGRIRLFMDADNSTDLSHFDRMKPFFDGGDEVVICSRDHKDVASARQAVPQPLLKRVLGNAGNLFIQLVAVPGIWDTQCGFKAFTAVAAERIFSVSVIDHWGFDIEALALCRRFGFRLSIIPADWVDDAETHVRTWNYFGTIWETLKIRWNLISGTYEQTIPVAPVNDRPRLSDN